MEQKRPNIVFILTDDQGAWALHCGGNPEIRTPALDRLAMEGMRLQNFFCASPVCSPARASIFTGRIPSQHGVHDWICSGNLDRDSLGDKKDDPVFANERKAIPYIEGMTTFTDILAERGYQCALAGKWHLGDSRHPQHGFSRWYTIARGGCLYYKPEIVENGELRYENQYITDLITEKAITYLDEMSREDAPFYLSVHYTAPHDPWDESQHPKEFTEMYRDCKFESTPDLPIHPNQVCSAPHGTGEVRKSLLRGYYAAVSAMDAGVGRILNRLEAMGERDNTIVVFMADNGMNMGHHGIWGKGNGTFPLNLYDTSVKVPFIISWPQRIPKGLVSESMHSQYDFMHTLLDLAGIKATLPGGLTVNPEEGLSEGLAANLPERFPGKSFGQELLSGQVKQDGEVVVFDEYGPNRMIRTLEWKLIHRYPYGPDELYHVSEDPDEEENLIGQEQYKEVKEKLLDKLNQWFLRYADPKLDASREAVTGFGQFGRAGLYSNGKETYGKLVK